MHYRRYSHKNKDEDDVVLLKNVVQPKKYQFRADNELTKDIEDFKKEMGQGDSKVIQDILNDFFLTRDCERRKAEMEGF